LVMRPPFIRACVPLRLSSVCHLTDVECAAGLFWDNPAPNLGHRPDQLDR
jgi:hypothetical protein